MTFYSKRTEEPRKLPRFEAKLGEILPRLTLLEDLVGGLRVLEVGVEDTRTLMQLQSFGAEQVVGTCCNPGALESDLVQHPNLALVSMERGILEFNSSSFDCVIVNDCGLEIQGRDSFLHELSRVLAPDGFCVLAFDLSAAHSKGLEQTMVHLVNQQFGQIQWVKQRTFLGVSLQSENDHLDDTPVQLDLSYASDGDECNFMIALCGPVAPLTDSRMLFELSPTLVEQPQVNQNIRELQDALTKAQRALSVKSESIRSLSRRIEPIRDAIRSQLVPALPTEIVRDESQIKRIHDLERQLAKVTAQNHMLQLVSNELPSTNEPTHASLARERILSEQLETALNQNVSLQQRLSRLTKELESRSTPSVLNSEELLQLEIALVAKQNECEDLQRRLDLSERRLSARVSSPDNPVISNDGFSEQVDSNRNRIEELEEERKEQGQRIIELERFFRNASAELTKLKETTGLSEIQREREETKLKSKIAALVSALQVSESEVHSLRNLLDEAYERQSSIRSTSERELDEVESRFHLQREVSEKTQAELDTARREVFEARANLENAQRNLATKSSQIDELRTQFVGLQADKAALELVTGELSQELETTRKKFYTLKSDHEALMATSRAMIDEHDIALELATNVGKTEERVHELNKALEGSQAAIKRLEWENDALQLNISEKETALSETTQALEKTTHELSLASEKSDTLLERQKRSQTHLVELEDRIAEGQKYIQELEGTISEQKDEIVELQELMHDIRQEALDTKRDHAAHSSRAEQLQRDLFEAQELIESLQSEILQLEREKLTQVEQQVQLESKTALDESHKVLQDLEEFYKVKAEASANLLRNRELEIQELEVQVAALLGMSDENDALRESLMSLKQEKESLVEQVNQLANLSLAYSESDEYVEHLQDLNHQLKEENLRLNVQVESRSTFAKVQDVLQLTSENDDLRSRIELLQESKNRMTDELSASQQELSARQDEINRLNQEAILTVQQKNELLEKVIVFEEQVELLEAQVENYETRSKEVAVQFRDSQTVAMDALEQIEMLEQRMIESSDKLKRYQNEKTAMIVRIQTLENQLQSAGDNQNDSSRSRLSVVDEKQDKSEELTSLRFRNQQLSYEKEEMAADFARRELGLQGKLREATEEKNKLQADGLRLKENAEAYEAETQAEIEELAEHILNSRKQEELLTARISELEERLSVNEESLQAPRFVESDELIQELRRELAISNERTDDARVELAEKMGEMRQLQETLESLRDEFAEHMGEYSRAMEEFETLKASSSSPDRVREAEQSITKLESQLRSSTQEQERLRRVAQRAEEELAASELKVSEAQGSLKEKARQIELLRSEVAEKAERLRRLSKNLDNR